MEYRLVSFGPTGDQPDAIRQLVEGFRSDLINRPYLGLLVLKDLYYCKCTFAAKQTGTGTKPQQDPGSQLYSEFKQFFPENLVEYFVSYYDYYQPEAYLPVTDTYIEKDLSINDEIEKLRLSATSSLMSGRKDVIVVSSVSCLYGIGNPDDFHANVISVKGR